MRPLLAHIVVPEDQGDRRRAGRRTLRLDVAAQSSTLTSSVVIRNLSRTGLLIETDAPFAAGETFMLVLPEIGATPARVVRAKGRSFGCEFLSPVPASAISAALLKAPYEDAAAVAAEPAVVPELYDDSEFIAHPPSRLVHVATILLTIAILTFVFSLLSLSFSAG